MIITRTPYRISFFGGGSDYPVWYEQNGGAVLSTAINKYCYISCRRLPPFFEHKSRIVWSRIESINSVNEIVHPSVRETLKFLNIHDGVAINHDGDLPARSGLGSSSVFTVGLLHALYALQGKLVTKRQLALDAIQIEQERLKENVGAQDQAIAAFGGFNKIEFGGPEKLAVHPITAPYRRLEELQNHLMLFFTGLSRTASEIAGEQIRRIPERASEIKALAGMVDTAMAVLAGNGPIDEFGKLLHEGWNIKKNLTKKISNHTVDNIYETARRAGALGGKLLGAGGGGFMVFFVKPELRQRVAESLKGLLHVPFRFESLGSQIIYYGPPEII